MAETRYIEGQERYALMEMIGRGGFATVWRAESKDGSFFGRNEEVAVKIIPIYSVAERSRAMREGQIAEDLRHPNIVETLEVIPGDTEMYLVTEFVRGKPLNEAAETYTMERVVDSLAQILEALAYAHERGIIHRDIKPQNALVNARGVVKLTDFGIAFRAEDTRLTRVGYAVGTPGYMAPEIMSGSDPSELTDIYAAGATAQTLLSRHPDEPPPRLREFIDRATSPNPAHRPQSAREALALLTGKRARPAPQPADSGKTRLIPKKHSAHALRGINGLIAAWLGYMGAGLILQNGAWAVGVAAGFAVLGYLLPRLAALAVIVALAVALLMNGVGLGFGAVVPAIGAVWVSVGRGELGKLPLGPLLAVPAVAVGLGAGIPLFFGALMRPLGATLSSAAGAVALLTYDLVRGDGFLPYFGVQFQTLPAALGAQDLLYRVGRILQVPDPRVIWLPALWAAMAAAISFGEWFGRPFAGLGVAVVGGALGYALAIQTSAASLNQAVTSLGFAAIIYGLFRYLGMRARR